MNDKFALFVGTVVAVMAGAGDYVRKGQVLARYHAVVYAVGAASDNLVCMIALSSTA